MSRRTRKRRQRRQARRAYMGRQTWPPKEEELKSDVPELPPQSRLTDTRRMSPAAAKAAWEEYVRSCALTGLLFNNITIAPDGTFLIYDEMDEDDCKLIGLNDGGGPVEVWIGFRPIES